MTLRAPLLFVFLGLVGCTDLPTGPDPTNPYDPAYSGSRQVSTPTDVALEASTSQTLTLTWTDASSFEAGYRIERAHIPVATFDPSYRTIAVVGEDVTAYTDEVPLNTSGYLYRVVGVASHPDRESAPSEALHIRIPSNTFSVSANPNFGGSRFSRDGSLLYTSIGATYGGLQTLLATNTRTGRRAWSVPGVPSIVQTLSGGRIVAVDQSADPSRLTVVGPGGAILRDVTLETGAGCRVVGVDESVTRAVGGCGRFANELRVWDLRTGRWLPSLTNPAEAVLAVSPDGTLAVVRRGTVVVVHLVDERRELWDEAGCPFSPASFTADGEYVYLSGCADSGQLRHSQSGRLARSAKVRDLLRLDDSGRYLYYATSPYDEPDARAYLQVSDVVEGVLARSALTPPSYAYAGALSVLPDGGLVVMWDAHDSAVTRWEPGSRWEAVGD